MTFAPVGIRCPDHANVGAVKPAAAAHACRACGGRRRSIAAPATMALIAINVVVYMSPPPRGAASTSRAESSSRTGLSRASRSSDGDWWRLVTAMFLHGSMLHLAFNMLALFWLGTIVEQALGTPRFLLVYFVSGLAGSAGALWFSSAFAVTVGASGAIFGLIGALLILEYLATGSLMGQAHGPDPREPRAHLRASRTSRSAATSAGSPAGSSRPTR